VQFIQEKNPRLAQNEGMRLETSKNLGGDPKKRF
jgi:hypothetical protein